MYKWNRLAYLNERSFLKEEKTPSVHNRIITGIMSDWLKPLLKEELQDLADEPCNMKSAEILIVGQTVTLLCLIMQFGYADRIEEFTAAAEAMWDDVLGLIKQYYDENKYSGKGEKESAGFTFNEKQIESISYNVSYRFIATIRHIEMSRNISRRRKVKK